VDLLPSLNDIIERIAAVLRVDGEVVSRMALRVLGIWLLAWVALRVVRLTARRIEESVDDGDDSVTTLREKRGRTISQLLRSVGRVVIVTIALLLTFNVFINIAPILAGAGILGLAVSFGAQSLVRDIISGFFILLENQFAVGDVVDAGGKSGVVEKMTLRVVVLRDLEGTMHVIPNGEIKVVSNHTRGWARAVVDISVPYTEDLRDNSVVIRSLLKTQPGSQWNVAREFRRRLKTRFDREAIETPFQQRRVNVTIKGGAGSEAIAAAASGAAG
jgi:small conductance mechanosensitive channel